MGRHKILFINLGYARGIGGALGEHLRYGHRHFYCTPEVQAQNLAKLAALVEAETPDIACIVEIERGARGLNQIDRLTSRAYPFADIENKYGPGSLLRALPFTAGKSNGFIARRDYPFEKIFFNYGAKRLVYRVELAPGLTLFFAHFSLKKDVRARQMLEARGLMRRESGEVLFLGDFNVLSGLDEVTPLLDGGRFVLLNRADMPTFLFHRQRRVLDLCICSRGLVPHTALAVLPQPFTDHAALTVEIA